MKLILRICFLLCLFPFVSSAASLSCSSVFLEKSGSTHSLDYVSFGDVQKVMEKKPYNIDRLPVIPIKIFNWIGKKLKFFVGVRSVEILQDTRDYRELGQTKPIHPMGVGLLGTMRVHQTRWTGIFRGGNFPLIARASISQGNPLKITSEGLPQKRSTAMAIKLFDTFDKGAKTKTANAVFQNDLNGLLDSRGNALNFLESSQTNHPGLNFGRISEAYEVGTLLGVALGTIKSRYESTGKLPFINPQIRPPHSWAELGETNRNQIRTPVWVKIEPRLEKPPVNESDFRIEIYKTLERDGVLIYNLYAADKKDSRGQILWEVVGEIQFSKAILSEGVDQNLLFPHDGFQSKFSAKDFVIPQGAKQYDSVPEDVQ